MSFDSDLVVDRRRLRRQLSFWRVLSILVVIGALVGVGLSYAGSRIGGLRPHVARIEISGLITGNQATLDVLERAQNPMVKAVVLRINSGGGTTAGSETLYNAVRALAAKKPVVAVIDGVGASGAYMTALGADHIIANGSAIVGSVGVIAQVPNVTRLLDNWGVKMETVRSSPIKALPNGLEPTPPEARAALEETVRDTYIWFKALVGERRKLDGAALDNVTDARVFTGRQALGLKLIDALGDEKTALAWLAANKNLPASIPVVPYLPKAKSSLSGFTALAGLARSFGLPEGALDDLSERLSAGTQLDGLVSLWQPLRQ